MKELLIVGIDVSKATLDICIKPQDTLLHIVNAPQGFVRLRQTLESFRRADTSVLVVMEHTGRYSHRLEEFLQARHIDYCKLAALTIKRSLGLIRGKHDQIRCPAHRRVRLAQKRPASRRSTPCAGHR